MGRGQANRPVTLLVTFVPGMRASGNILSTVLPMSLVGRRRLRLPLGPADIE